MLLAALEAQLAERSQRQIAEALYGRAAVARAWQLDGGMRSEVRRRVDEALFYMEVGYRDRPIPASASTSTAGWGRASPRLARQNRNTTPWQPASRTARASWQSEADRKSTPMHSKRAPTLQFTPAVKT